MAHTFDPRVDALHGLPYQHKGTARAHHALLRRLDPTRICAEAGAIAINAAALLLLLAPLHPQLPLAVEPPEAPFIIPVSPTTPPPRVEVVKPQPIAPMVPNIAAPVIEPLLSEIPPPLVEATPGDTALEPPQVENPGSSDPAAAHEPVSAAYLEYAFAPPPTYPRVAMREGRTGTVTLRVLVGVDGRPVDVQIARSSGHRVLDVAARRHVLEKWRFKPAMHDGQPVQAIGLVPIDFTL